MEVGGGARVAVLWNCPRSQTGTAEEVAWDLVREGRAKGFACMEPQVGRAACLEQSDGDSVLSITLSINVIASPLIPYFARPKSQSFACIRSQRELSRNHHYGNPSAWQEHESKHTEASTEHELFLTR